MDKRIAFPGGEIAVTQTELDLMPNSNREGIEAVAKGITGNVDAILSGVNAVITAGVSCTVSAGWVYLDGEVLQVDAQVVPRTVASDLYHFVKVVTNPAAYDRTFRDASTNNVAEIQRAVPTNVLSLPGGALSVTGTTILNLLKTSIRVQADWTEANASEPDFIKNKPTFLSVLLSGRLNVGNIDDAGTLSVRGQLTGASIINENEFDGHYRVNFASVGTVNYHPILTILSLNADWDRDGQTICQARAKTATSLDILMHKFTNEVSDLAVLITLIPLDESI